MKRLALGMSDRGVAEAIHAYVAVVLDTCEVRHRGRVSSGPYEGVPGVAGGTPNPW